MVCNSDRLYRVKKVEFKSIGNITVEKFQMFVSGSEKNKKIKKYWDLFKLSQKIIRFLMNFLNFAAVTSLHALSYAILIH